MDWTLLDRGAKDGDDDDEDGVAVVAEDERESHPEELSEEYFARDKRRSYIHRPNSKLSGTLNTVLLGTVLVTACLALGHVWGTTDDCSPQMSSTLSELSFDLQELRHENHVLRSKLAALEALEATRCVAEGPFEGDEGRKGKKSHGHGYKKEKRKKRSANKT